MRQPIEIEMLGQINAGITSIDIGPTLNTRVIKTMQSGKFTHNKSRQRTDASSALLTPHTTERQEMHLNIKMDAGRKHKMSRLI